VAKLRELERTAWLERARDARTDEEVLANLVNAWRAAPLIASSELVAAASSRAARPVKLVDQAAWLAAAARHDPAELPALLATVQTGRSATARERADALAKWPPDPRIAPGLLAMMPRSQLRGRATRPFWTIVFRIVHRQFHAGIADAIAAIDHAGMDDEFGDYVDVKLRSLRRRLESAHDERLDPATRALVDAISAKLEIASTKEAAKSTDDFIREIWAAPLDDGLREVFADWLIARSDPRGELIMLQMTRKRRGLDAEAQKREAALLKQHARAWMGPLDPVVDKKRFRFEGGFLYACRVDARALVRTPALMTHPAWSTVREYVLDGSYDRQCDAWLDHMIAFGAKRK